MKTQIYVVILSFLLLLTMVGGVSMAEENTGNIDEEVLKILYEKTENPEAWVTFINQNAEDGLGKWLPLLIKKIADPSEGASKTLANVHYKTITEGFDWGPAIGKIVLDFGMPIDAESLSINTFDVKSIRYFKDFDFTTFSYDDKVTAHEVTCPVTHIYKSDANGMPMENGDFVTLEMAVGPQRVETSPLNYNMLTSKNEYVKIRYRISLNPGTTLTSQEGEKVVMIPTDDDAYSKDVKLVADEFENNQSFEYSNIKLLYASYTPKTASKETGKNPLIIWLHGAGEGGNDTTIPLLGNKVVNLATDKIQKLFGETGSYVLVPQSPTMWMDYDGTGIYNNTIENSDGKSYYQEALMALIDQYVSEHPEIDKDRIYIGGCSNGGYMTVNMIINYPDYFAAAFPICEAYSAEWLTEDRLEAIKKMPIWLTHALSDGVVAIAEGELDAQHNVIVKKDADGMPILKKDFSNALYDQLKSLGAMNVHYSRFDKVVDTSGMYKAQNGVDPYEYMGHFSWVYALNNECVETIEGEEVTLFEWLADQSK
ncbi:prolyl oligopeptidase family serine peptidase [Fusibacter ferrireducens]|uniref:Prolyl oligopeptidase family serine peptidase n=1 Tax=Fusibacter ferrireducens TaxID=2785058 RepID=A0ABR9ZMB7_9FIRM|nr:prolyl oligopeptidase family serine peptidase [Fusibacter ferrireducens]MBF4691615.1 prolyl oligopeptidase family serine peptidase [Fusibacter ferrireducens]